MITFFSVGRVRSNDILVYLYRVEDAFEWSFLDRFTGIFIKLGLNIKAFHVADTAAEKNPNYGFGSSLFMRASIGSLPRFLASESAIIKKHRAQCQARESHAGIDQERAARDTGTRAGIFLFHTFNEPSQSRYD